MFLAELKEPWLILPETFDALYREAKARDSLKYNELFSGGSGYHVRDGIATIDIVGPMMKRESLIFRLFGGILTPDITRNVRRAVEDPNVGSILLSIDSPGGQVGGIAELADTVYRARSQKPIWAFVDGLGASASYWVASAAEKIIVNNQTGRVGSIGVTAIHADYSKRLENRGVTVTVFASGKYKKVGNQYEPLSKSDEQYITGHVTTLYSIFRDSVSRFRGIPTKRIEGTEGSLLFAREALKLGLIDEIESLETTISKLKGKSRNGSTITRERTSMKFQNYDLKTIAESIQQSATIEDLKAAEDAVVVHCNEKDKSAKNWIEKRDAKYLKEQAHELIAMRRRQILAQPKIERERELYALGRRIGGKAHRAD